MSGASWPSSGSPQNPMNMLMEMFGSAVMPSGMTPGQFSPNQSWQDTQEARQFSKGTMGGAMALGGQQAATGIQDMIMGTQPGGGLVGMGLMSEEKGQKAAAWTQSSDFATGMGNVLPWAGMFAPSGAMEAMGMGGMSMGMDIGGMFRGQMQTPGVPGSGMTSGQLEQGITQLGSTAQQRLFSGTDRTPTSGFGQAATGRFAAQAQRKGRGPGQIDWNKQADKDKFSDWMGSNTRPMSAIRDLGGQYANMDEKQMGQALNMVTMGGFDRGVGDEELESQTRMFKQLSRQAQISPGEGMGLQQMAGQRIEQLGGDMMGGVSAGQHGMAFGAYAKEQGGDFLKSTGSSASELMQKDAILTAQAGRSEVGNLAASMMRMGEAGMLKGESKEVYEQLKDKGEFNITDSNQMRKLLQQSGVNMGAAANIMSQRGENLQRFGEDVAGAVRKQQWETDIQPVMQRMVAQSLQIGAKGAGKRMSGSQSMEGARMVTDTIREMAGKSPREITAAIAEKFVEQGASEEDARAAAEGAIGAAGEASRRKGYRGVGEIAALHGKGGLEAVEQTEEEAEVAAAEESRTRGKGQKDWAERLGEGLKKGDKQLGKAVARFLGGEEDDKTAAGGDKAAKPDTTDTTDATPDPQSGGAVVNVNVVNPIQLVGADEVAHGSVPGPTDQPMDQIA